MGCHLTILLPRLALHSLPFHRYSTMKVSHFIFLGHSPNVTSSTEPLMNVAWELSILSPGLSNPLVECSPKLPKGHKAWTVEHPGSKRKRCHLISLISQIPARDFSLKLSSVEVSTQKDCRRACLCKDTAQGAFAAVTELLNHTVISSSLQLTW